MAETNKELLTLEPYHQYSSFPDPELCENRHTDYGYRYTCYPC